jgi:hypothetical protein
VDLETLSSLQNNQDGIKQMNSISGAGGSFSIGALRYRRANNREEHARLRRGQI